MIFKGLTKTYGGRCVLDIPELELEKGKIYAVVGANGSGKSTLAKLIARTLKADGGYIKSDVSIGYMPQKCYAFKMSTRKNLRINRSENSSVREDKLMDALGIDALANEKATKLSGGETARMALARLLMKEYELIVLDEPTSAMDIESTFAAEKLICDYRDETGCAVLLITHSVSEAERIADEIIFLSSGILTEQGSPEALIHAPENEKTKQFIDFYSK